MKDAPHPNAARLFETFMYSREYSQALVRSYNFPLRSDVTPANGKDLKDLRWYRNQPSRLLEGIPQVIELWRKVFGGV
jgi:ABC-type Fe3+ transport system substrate-binding protein